MACLQSGLPREQLSQAVARHRGDRRRGRGRLCDLRPSSPGVGGPSRLTIAGCLGFAIRGPINERCVPVVVTEHGDGAGILPAGRRPAVPGRLHVHVPEGWVNDGDYGPVYTAPDTPANEAEYALSKQTAQNIVLTDRVQNNMFAICDATGLFRARQRPRVIAAVVANEAFSTTEPDDVTIGGLSGRQVDLQLSPDWADSCPLTRTTPRPGSHGRPKSTHPARHPRSGHHRDRYLLAGLGRLRGIPRGGDADRREPGFRIRSEASPSP